MIDTLISAGEMFGALTVALSLAMIHPKSRRVVAVFLRFAKRHLPRWAAIVVAILAIIPGQVDELLIVPVILVIVLRDKKRRTLLKRYINVAIRG